MFKGNNIYLRLLEKEDVRILYNLYNDEKVKKYNTISDDVQGNNKVNKSCKSLRKALSIVNEKGVLIGFITYKESDYLKNVYFIGITIGSMYWNRGYGQDSIKVLAKYLFKELNAMRIELEVIKSNFRAINCYKKCGFIEDRIKTNRCYIDGQYIDTIIMVLKKNHEVIDLF